MNQPTPPNFLAVMGSVIAAAFGVQSSKNRLRDFQGGSPVPFIIGGIVFTLLFILAIVTVVHWVVK